jgi:hypothetical protein
MWWTLIVWPLVGLVAWLILYVKLSVRRLNHELTPAEDRGTDALKKIDMVDPDDPETWLLFLDGTEIPK